MPISKYTVDGKFICTYPDKETCSEFENINQSSLTNVLEGRSLTLKGFRWKTTAFLKQRDLKPFKQRKNYKKIIMGDIEFASIGKCAKYLGVGRSTIGSMLLGLSPNKYNVKYAENK